MWFTAECVDATIQLTTDNRRHWLTCSGSQALSELFQHEIDHLDGILAVDRAIDEQAIIKRTDYEADRDKYDAMVEYTIQSTIIDTTSD
jgi:peptide deformylase